MIHVKQFSLQVKNPFSFVWVLNPDHQVCDQISKGPSGGRHMKERQENIHSILFKKDMGSAALCFYDMHRFIIVRNYSQTENKESEETINKK